MRKKALKKIAKKKLSICCLESATAGYIACRLSQSQYSGIILDGGLVCYDLSIKRNILKIKQSLIDKYSAESEQVTQEMIRKGRKIFNSDIYIACTGLLKPGGSETVEKPVGTFFYAIFYKDQIYHYKIQCSGNPKAKLKKVFEEICISLDEIIN